MHQKQSRSERISKLKDRNIEIIQVEEERELWILKCTLRTISFHWKGQHKNNVYPRKRRKGRKSRVYLKKQQLRNSQTQGTAQYTNPGSYQNILLSHHKKSSSKTYFNEAVKSKKSIINKQFSRHPGKKKGHTKTFHPRHPVR